MVGSGDGHCTTLFNTYRIPRHKRPVPEFSTSMPGSTHVAYILMNSHIADIFGTGQIQTGCLLVNSAYPLKPWLLTPVSDPKTHLSVATM